MKADIITLYRNDFCEIKNFLYHCTDCALSKPEFQDHFSICYIRRGNFLFKVFRRDLDAYSGLFLLNKPGFEHRVGHDHHIPDECTIFSFDPFFYEELVESYQSHFNGFFKKRDIHSMLIKPNMSAEYLHHRIFHLTQQRTMPSLQFDSLILKLFDKLFDENQVWANYRTYSSSQKKNYLPKIERAKAYIQTHFTDDISLADVTSACYMSKFHFTRIFRKITGITPHQYLIQYRLNHANYLLVNSSMSVSQIAYESGFNDSNYFSTAFKTHFNISPSSV